MFTIPLEITTAIDTLNSHGHSAFIVGGCVRDTLMGITPNDYDITTSATPQEIINIFEKTIPTGIKHGTVTVIINNQNIEITTFRTEGNYSDCRRPDKVNFVKNLKEDLSRRDFTINALAYNAKLIDYFNGKEDIQNKILRTVGNPEKRFKEDALRILRLFRFASTLNFTIEENTLKAALEYSDLLPLVSRERIAVELKKSVLGSNIEIFKPLFEIGGLAFLKINQMPDSQKIKSINPNQNLALFEFLNGSEEALLELKPSNKEKTYFSCMNYLLSLKKPTTKAEIKEMLNKTSVEIVKDYLTLTNQNETLLNEVLKFKEPYKISDLDISGEDLLKLGFKGEQIKEKLEFLRRLVVENPSLNTKTNLLANLSVTL